MRILTLVLVLVLVASGGSLALSTSAVRDSSWSREEKAQIASLRLSSLGPLPPDPGNRFADDERAVAFGHQLFFDTRLSSNGKVSCASCHIPTQEFQDGTPLAQGVGTTDRRTMPIASTAYSPWQFWDGRKDSQWAQALGPLESPVEHGGSRGQYAQVISRHYRKTYEAIFGAMPRLTAGNAGPVEDAGARATWRRLSATAQDDITQVYVNIGKAIAAYERRIQYGPTRFDVYADSIATTGKAPAGILSASEEAGLRLFIGKAQCVNCHNGALFTDNHFHNTGVSAAHGLPRDVGRAAGAKAVLQDEFNCRSKWSDAGEGECAELDFIVAEGEELVRAFKTPSLRNVAERPPYMHAGQIADLDAVVRHYDRAPKAPEGKSELRRLGLTAAERQQLVAFLRVLSAPVRTPAYLLQAPR